MILSTSGWSARKNYMLQAIAKDDEAQNIPKSMERISSAVIITPNHNIHHDDIISDKPQSSAKFRQLSSKMEEIADSPSKKPCTPYRIPSAVLPDEDEEMSNEEEEPKVNSPAE